jgi:hypothetical protein
MSKSSKAELYTISHRARWRTILILENREERRGEERKPKRKEVDD